VNVGLVLLLLFAIGVVVLVGAITSAISNRVNEADQLRHIAAREARARYLLEQVALQARQALLQANRDHRRDH
jgi:hypothetical protein